MVGETINGKNLSPDKQIGILAYLCRKRKLAAKVFPHCGERGYSFSRFVQGQRLSLSALKALKRF